MRSNGGSGSQVEAGNYCLRTNPKGVDLNRNWDVALASLKMWDGHKMI